MGNPNLVFGSALCIIGFGYALKSLGFVQASDAKFVSKFLMHTTFPALVIVTMTHVEFNATLLWMPFICFCFGVLSSFLGFQLFRQEPRETRGILSMGCSGYNLGLFAFPLIEGIWGWKGLAFAAMFDIGNSIINFTVTYGVGVFLADRPGQSPNLMGILRRIFSLPPFQAMLIGLSINLFKIPVPDFLMGIVDTIAKGNKPLVLLLMGLYFSVRLGKEAIQKVFKVLGLRYALGLSIGFTLYALLPFDTHFRNMLLICLILPAGMTLITYSDELGYPSTIAAALVNFSMLISFALMWILVYALNMAPL